MRIAQSGAICNCAGAPSGARLLRSFTPTRLTFPIETPGARRCPGSLPPRPGKNCPARGGRERGTRPAWSTARPRRSAPSCTDRHGDTACRSPVPAPLAMKAELRTRLHARRNALAAEDRARFSASITDSLLALDAYRRARNVLAYMTFVRTDDRSLLARRASPGKNARPAEDRSCPRSSRSSRRVRISIASLAAGPWGIREHVPDICPVAELSEIDFILVPGLGFTAHGDRVGYGRGYYDRLLANRGPRTALVAGAFRPRSWRKFRSRSTTSPSRLVDTQQRTYGGCSP